jgi:riboflavin kinase
MLLPSHAEHRFVRRTNSKIDWQQGKVVEGFQRGSKQMGVPTANVAPCSVQDKFEKRPKGVFFGWAQLQQADNEADGQVHPMVLNYGMRPTFKDGSNVTVRL